MPTKLEPVADYRSYRVTVGCDPEMFLYNTKTGCFVSAHNIVPGTKKKPHALDSFSRESSCQADGVAAEINIAPATTSAAFVANAGAAALSLHNLVTAHNPNLRLAPVPVATFDKDYFEKLPASAKELGCDPDYDAYNDGKPNPRPTSLPIATARTGAGHISVGWRKPGEFVKDPFEPAHFNDCIMMVQMMDEIHEHIRTGYEKDNADYRRLLYGKRGAFRPKPFGVEYRTPSNSWLLDVAAAQNMFTMAYTAFILLTLGYIPGTKETTSNLNKVFSDTRKRGFAYLSETDRSAAVSFNLDTSKPYSLIQHHMTNYMHYPSYNRPAANKSKKEFVIPDVNTKG